MKHGHVTPLPDGLKARCGGPGLCDVCQRELAELGGAKPVRKREILETLKVIGNDDRFNVSSQAGRVNLSFMRKGARSFTGFSMRPEQWRRVIQLLEAEITAQEQGK